jgi:hypothetical protein
MEFMKLHKEVFLTTDIFFVNKIPFFLTLSRKICFTAVNHLADRTVPHIFKAFKEMYQYYLQPGFHIKTVHADGEFTPLKPLIEYTGGFPFRNSFDFILTPTPHMLGNGRKLLISRVQKTQHA